MLDEYQLKTLYEFHSGNRSWEEWPRWLAIHAARMAKQLDREQFQRLKKNPQEEIPSILHGCTFEVSSTKPKLAHDPIEDDPATKELIDAAGEEAIAELGIKDFSQMGTCHLIWHAQKRILKEQHGIQWRSPAEMNQDVIFD